jgi:hypothetical protein
MNFCLSFAEKLRVALIPAMIFVKGNATTGEPDRYVRYLLKNGERDDPIKSWEGFCARLESEGS